MAEGVSSGFYKKHMFRIYAIAVLTDGREYDMIEMSKHTQEGIAYVYLYNCSRNKA